MVDEADLGRDCTKTALFELRQRLLQAGPINEVSITAYTGHRTVANVRQNVTPTRAPRAIVSPTDSSDPEDEHHATNQGRHDSQDRRGSRFAFFKRQRPDNTPRPQQATAETCRPTPVRQPSARDAHEIRESRRPTFNYQPGEYQPGEDDPFKIWGFDSADQELGGREAVRVDSGLSMAETIVAGYTSSQYKMKLNFGNHPFPTPENNFCGFCKGAWKMQNGYRKAMTIRNDYSQSAQSKAGLSCTKCGYKCPFNEDVLWNKVFTVSSQGIKARFSFLAKSHVPHRQLADSQYYYQCIFCVFMGLETRKMNSKQYLDHIVLEHRGAKLSSVVLNRTKCVNDRICDDSEEFDINLFPVAESQQSSPRTSSLASVPSIDLGNTGMGMENTFPKPVNV